MPSPEAWSFLVSQRVLLRHRREKAERSARSCVVCACHGSFAGRAAYRLARLQQPLVKAICGDLRARRDPDRHLLLDKPRNSAQARSIFYDRKRHKPA
jgi:hypothetical protein